MQQRDGSEDCKKRRVEHVRHIRERKEVAFVKQVGVGGVQMKAYIDGGNQSSLIGRSKAAEIGGIVSCRQIQGFGAKPLTCSSVLTTDVVVDGQGVRGNLHLVDDDKLECNEVLLGTKLLCGAGQRRLMIGDNECFVQPTFLFAKQQLDQKTTRAMTMSPMTRTIAVTMMLRQEGGGGSRQEGPSCQANSRHANALWSHVTKTLP